MATIKEIAERAGVSRGTVDRVLNNRGNVNPETEQKIRQIMKELHYEPNPAGMALAAQKKKSKIGVILFSKKNPFFDDVMQGFLDKAKDLSFYGCELFIQRVAYHPEAQLSAISACLKQGVQGLIITPYNDPRITTKINQLINANIPVITVNSDIENTRRLSFIGSDYYQSGRVAASMIAKMTHGDVHLGIVSGDQKILCHTERCAGFADYLSEDSRFKVVAQGENFDDDQQSYDLVSSMLDKHPDINCFYFTAAGVNGGCRAIAERFKPGEIPVIAFDEVPTTIDLLKKGYISATICQEPYWQGVKALETLFQFLSDPSCEIADHYYAKLSLKISEMYN